MIERPAVNQNEVYWTAEIAQCLPGIALANLGIVRETGCGEIMARRLDFAATSSDPITVPRHLSDLPQKSVDMQTEVGTPPHDLCAVPTEQPDEIPLFWHDGEGVLHGPGDGGSFG